MPEDDGPRLSSQPNWTTIALIGGLVFLLVLVAYFATNRDSNQDKLTGNAISEGEPGAPEKACSNKATYDLIKRELFRRAAQLRGSDQAAFDKLSAVAVIRMDNPVMESEDSKIGAVNCSGSLSLDLPPGVAAVGGRRNLMSDVDYTVQDAADGSGRVVLLRNADAIIAPLATLARIGQAQPAAPAVVAGEIAPAEPTAAGSSDQPSVAPPPTSAPSHPATRTHPSFDCANARTKGEIAVCSDSGLAALDVNMAAQYRRALNDASPQERAILQSSRDRFLGYRDRCPNRQCIADAYVGRMREIRDIMEGHWSSPR
jgi:uncharacterized protein YecT (DUF1311 family)